MAIQQRIVDGINWLADKLIPWSSPTSGPLPKEPLKTTMPPVKKFDDILLTHQESEVVEKLAEAWNLYLSLPEQHPQDQVEFMHGLHDLQRIVMYRSAYRQLRLPIPVERASNGK